MGTNYDIDEWVTFEIEGLAESESEESEERYGAELSSDDILEHLEFTKDLESAQDKFTRNAVRVVNKWMKTHPRGAIDLENSDDTDSDDDIAWNTWAGLGGYGVGFWEHQTTEDADSLQKAMRSDKALGKAHTNLENAMWDAMAKAAERATKKKNPPRGSRRGAPGRTRRLEVGRR